MLSIVAGAVAAGLVEYILQQLLPHKPKVKHTIAIIAAIIAFSSVAVWASSVEIIYPEASAPAESSLAPQQPARVLIDIRHNQVTDAKELLKYKFKDIELVLSETSEFSLERLSSYAAVLIDFPQYPGDEEPGNREFTESEIAAIQAYINQGGGVFLIGPSWVWVDYEKRPLDEYPLNQISRGYGIFFDNGGLVASADDKDPDLLTGNLIAEHAITQGISRIAIRGKSIPGPLTINDNLAEAILQYPDVNGNSTILAATKNGHGRIVALQHGDPVFAFLDDVGYDNLKLLDNILHWLVEQ